MGGREGEREGETQADGGEGRVLRGDGRRPRQASFQSHAGKHGVSRPFPGGGQGSGQFTGVRQNLRLRSAGPAVQGSKGGDSEAGRAQGKAAVVCC